MKGIVAANAGELAVQIAKSLNSKGPRFTRRPFNRFDTARSLWWIVPSTEYPAYRFGKFFVDKVEDRYEVGLHVEKGWTQSIERKPELMMDNSWTWHLFVDALARGQVGERLLGIRQALGDATPITTRVEIPGLMEAGDERGQRVAVLRDGEWWDERRSEWTDLTTLPDWIVSIEGMDWQWADVFVTVALAKNDPAQGGEWSANDIVRHVFEPLEAWIK